MTKAEVKKHISKSYRGITAMILTAEVDYLKKGYFYGHNIGGQKTNLVNDNGDYRILTGDLRNSQYKSMQGSM